MRLKEASFNGKRKIQSCQPLFDLRISASPLVCLAGSAGTHCLCVRVPSKRQAYAPCTGNKRNLWRAYGFNRLINRRRELHDGHLLETLKTGTDKKFLLSKTPEDDETKYKLWVHSDKCLLMTVVSSTTEVVGKLLEELENLKCHHYVSKVQSNYLRFLKSTLPPTEAIVIMDIPENYNFIVQDVAQSFHRTARKRHFILLLPTLEA